MEHARPLSACNDTLSGAWGRIRHDVNAFMESLSRQGAFAGATPRDAYFVKCDKETTTQDDVNAGIVNVVVGFAPLKPAEFVIIKVQQRSGVFEVCNEAGELAIVY